jgi:hypothetical protein
MIVHRTFSARTLIMLTGACIALSVCFGSLSAQQPPIGHRQPKAGDLPGESSQKRTPRSPEDIALERALNNICRGCSPIIPVRSVPRYNVARTCPASLGEGSDGCRKDEEMVRQKLIEQWTTFTEKARSDCVQTNEIGGRPSYVQLGICLKAAQIAPTLREGR